MIERKSGQSLWRQIANNISDAIRSGTYPPGSKLPTEAELSQQYGVNRHTLRRAVSELAEAGVIRVEQGRGSFVQEHVLDYLVAKKTRFSDNVLRQRRTPGGRTLLLTEEVGDPAILKQLGLPRGTRLVRLDRIGEVDGRPISVGSHYFPAAKVPGFAALHEELDSITKVLTHFGYGEYTRRETRVTARMPDAADADHLQQPRNRPVLVIESINVDQTGMPIEYGFARYAADRFQLVFES
ncbi:phosphonate metabolism transcriptional regulator PhnF [uncultured Nisaea sp.]|uniref:phosphonate metabolism transcriptional regulator PhnF n=1 Tax=uncultured Nisaea sp. TaxID=538215 RepID=UPI0030ECA2C3